ncbi:MAG: MoaD/ThiS family protein [Candidatus Baltobacteraceae bacterium]
MRVRVLAFARLGELLGWTRRDVMLPGPSSTSDVWTLLAAQAPAIAPLAESTRIARNGRVVITPQLLEEDDEIALLPPVSGG